MAMMYAPPLPAASGTESLEYATTNSIGSNTAAHTECSVSSESDVVASQLSAIPSIPEGLVTSVAATEAPPNPTTDSLMTSRKESTSENLHSANPKSTDDGLILDLGPVSLYTASVVGGTVGASELSLAGSADATASLNGSMDANTTNSLLAEEMEKCRCLPDFDKFVEAFNLDVLDPLTHHDNNPYAVNINDLQRGREANWQCEYTPFRVYYMGPDREYDTMCKDAARLCFLAGLIEDHVAWAFTLGFLARVYSGRFPFEWWGFDPLWPPQLFRNAMNREWTDLHKGRPPRRDTRSAAQESDKEWASATWAKVKAKLEEAHEKRKGECRKKEEEESRRQVQERMNREEESRKESWKNICSDNEARRKGREEKERKKRDVEESMKQVDREQVADRMVRKEETRRRANDAWEEYEELRRNTLEAKRRREEESAMKETEKEKTAAMERKAAIAVNEVGSSYGAVPGNGSSVNHSQYQLTKTVTNASSPPSYDVSEELYGNKSGKKPAGWMRKLGLRRA